MLTRAPIDHSARSNSTAVIPVWARSAKTMLVSGARTATPGKAASAIELEIVLAQVVGEDKFKRWFANVKKQLVKDPRVGVPAKKTEAYIVRDEPVSAESEIMEEFANTRSARRRIALAEDLLAASIKEEAKQSLAQVLAGITEAVRDSNQLDASERLYGALSGLGATARLVLLPFESHGYAARESVLHMLWEMETWLDRHVRSAPPRHSESQATTDSEAP